MSSVRYLVRFLKPKGAEAIESGYVKKYYKPVGSAVKQHDPIMELETDKAALIETSPVDGILTKYHFKVDDKVMDKDFIYTIIQKGSSSERK